MKAKKLKRIIASVMMGTMLFTLPAFATPTEGEGVQEDIVAVESEQETIGDGTIDADAEVVDVDMQEDEVALIVDDEVESASEISLFTAPAVPDEFVGWTEVTEGTSTNNQFTRGGVSYTAITDANRTLFVANQIVNEDTGEVNTYVFNNGSGSTSHFYYRSDANNNGTDIDFAGSSTRYFTKTTGAMTTIGKYGETLDGKFAVIDIFDVSNTGIMTHSVTVKNIGTDTYTNFVVGAQIDTELNGQDRIPVYAIGNGGFYITDENITLYSEPLANVTAYAIPWTMYDNTGTSAAGAAYQTELLSGVDTAVNYEVPQRNSFAPGDSVSFSWTESVFVAGETISSVEAVYVDILGNTLQESTTITGMVGETYTLTPPSIANYEVFQVIGEVTGTFAAGPQTVHFVYSEILPAGKGGYIIQYLDEEGNEVKKPETLVEETGTQRTIEIPTIEGYEFVEADASLDITFTDKYQTLTLTYREVPAGTSVNADTNENQAATGKQSVAPKTGDEFNVLRNALMIVLSLSAVVVVTVIKRKRAALLLEEVIEDKE